ncbi:anthranilate phosphoribosyltransferase [Notoacmeibacter sp. MSK16QG-6]|uniref:anthranilate phosphoribosyltransferase n=1 Tax=Notoacmeibacter sp. MSK16QG-6 TaxID=2957982 RepID=UPI0020A1C0DE|nr:anthranilate phosphoribosyltransferase [Notoacmeibacter sp. MSK16QG-6]MCP1199332.1 anthranilate phosphoribosyltransferase [Notoacmeibacter sp. MSK16QG-6]
MTDAMKPLIAKLADGKILDRREARQAFSIMMDGEADPAQIGAFLMALRLRGETVEEIEGAVGAMRERMTGVGAPAEAIDIVGTGGDNSGSYNVSTAAAFIVAGCGVPIAKHGNRNLSSKSGAADTLAALGVNIEIGPELIARCIEKADIGFMFAPSHHAAMRHVGPSRVALGTRTIFNLLGPMSNPAGVQRQLIGVFSPAWLEPMARALRELGSEKLWIVHGSGLDEMTTAGETEIVVLDNGEISRRTVTPEDAGLPRGNLADLKGGDAPYNADALRRVLGGEKSAYRDIAIFNSAAALIVAGKASDLREGAEQAARSIDEGHAADRLTKLIEISNSAAA